MRLINTSTLDSEVFDQSRIPLRYAILSHRWTGQEVTFQEYQDLQKIGLARMLFKSPLESRSGYRKIQNCCRQAKEDGFEWVWIDTVCIDKSSSAELSEAINSMFLWYKESEVCYAYLEDVPAGEDYDLPGSSFRESRWFTRGWTVSFLILVQAYQLTAFSYKN
jgi:Heterokaryon incompatibility protein (HET)